MAVSIDKLIAELEEMQGYKQDFSIHPTISERRILVASDVHIPYHHAPTVAHLLAYAEDVNADAIVWLGDFVDNLPVSHYGNTDLRTTFRDQMDQAGHLIQLASEVVPVQYWSKGNHEERWMSKMGYQGDMELFARMANVGELMDSGRLVVSDDATWEYNHGDTEWMLTHPAEYSGTPLVVPNKLAEVFGKNTVSGHTHHWGMSTSASGRYTIIESGGLFDRAKVEYVNRKITSHRVWARGFVLLDDGNPTLIRG